MNWMDSVGGLLQQYVGNRANTADAENHFDQVSTAVPQQSLGSAVSDMMRSNETPPFSQLAAQMFGNANGTQKAGILNALIAAAGPTIASMLGARGGTVTPEDAERISPQAVQQAAEHAERHDPTIIDQMGSIYAQHPTLIKSLGGVALAVTLSKLADRLK